MSRHFFNCGWRAGGSSLAPVSKKVMDACFDHDPPYEVLEKAEVDTGALSSGKVENPSPNQQAAE